MLPRLSDVKHSVILPSVFAISSAVTSCFSRSVPLLKVTNAGVRRPGYKATTGVDELLLVNYKASTSRVCEQRHSPINNGSTRVRYRRPTGIGKQHWSLENKSDERPIMLCEREYCQETGSNNDKHNNSSIFWPSCQLLS